jgi:hypothetical protein
MKHVTYAEKSLLMNDEVADLLATYAASLADNGRADTVTVKGLSDDGNETRATFVLDAGTNLMVESTNATVPGPDDPEGLQSLKDKLALLESSLTAHPFSADDVRQMSGRNLDL